MENKTAMQLMYEYVDTHLRLEGYEHQVLLDKIASLRDNEEREQICKAFDARLNTIGSADDYYNKIYNR